MKAIRRSRQQGFTLLELVITMTIAAILLVIGVSSYKYITTSNRMAGEINSLLGDMQFARAEGIKEGQTVTICAANSTDTGCSGSANAWNAGWLVFSGDGPQPASSDYILRVRNSFSGGDTLQPADDTTSSVQFNREGFAMGLAGAVTMELHDPTGNSQYTRCLYLTIIGVPSTTGYGGTCQ